jgi:hypothetical protein
MESKVVEIGDGEGEDNGEGEESEEEVKEEKEEYRVGFDDMVGRIVVD